MSDYTRIFGSRAKVPHETITSTQVHSGADSSEPPAGQHAAIASSTAPTGRHRSVSWKLLSVKKRSDDTDKPAKDNNIIRSIRRHFSGGSRTPVVQPETQEVRPAIVEPEAPILPQLTFSSSPLMKGVLLPETEQAVLQTPTRSSRLSPRKHFVNLSPSASSPSKFVIKMMGKSAASRSSHVTRQPDSF